MRRKEERERETENEKRGEKMRTKGVDKKR